MKKRRTKQIKSKNKIIIECNGGGREVGNNAFIVDTGKERIALEFGFNVSDGIGPIVPKKKVDAVVVAHGHLDHCGSVPEIFKKQKPKVYGTKATKDLAELVLYDSVKLGKIKGKPRPFNRADVSNLISKWKKTDYNRPFNIGNTKATFYDAGHIPGSAMVLLETNGKRILYTSDFKTTDTQLVKGANVNVFKDIDILFIETTYSSRNQDNRLKVEKKFFKIVKDTINSGGIAMIPSFAIRAPEILMILEKHGAKFPVYIDGMGRQAVDIALNNPKFLKNSLLLKNAMKRTKMVRNDRDRRSITKKPCAIVTTSGSMDGGPAATYIKHIYSDPKSALILTGFQFPGSAGQYILDTGRYVTEEVDLKLKIPVYQVELSSHADRTELIDFVKKLRPKNIVCIHGTNCQRFATEMKGQFGIKTFAPKNGEVLEF